MLFVHKMANIKKRFTEILSAVKIIIKQFCKKKLNGMEELNIDKSFSQNSALEKKEIETSKVNIE